MITGERIGKAQAKGLLRHLNLRAKKGLGQHFLIDGAVLGKIVSASELAPDDTVVEVGPGLGVLTRELAKRAGRVIAVELDAELATALANALPNVSVVHADILETDIVELVGKGDIRPYKVVANLPYYITSPVLRHFLEAPLKPSLIVVMVQKEVGQAIVARPGDMSLLSVSVQFYGKPSIIDYVPARSFYPEPKVDSAIVRIDLYEKPPVEVQDTAHFFHVVRAGFSAPRKQLHNNLAKGLGVPSEEAVSLLEGLGIDPRRRAETLTLEEWARVCAQVKC